MLTLKKNVLITGALGAILLLAGANALAQNPAPTPNPPQRDATRPPGTETQNPSTPPGTQPAPPKAPPGIQQPAPQAPPGNPADPLARPTPATPGAPTVAPAPEVTTPTTDVAPIQDPVDPNFPVVERKPLPPMPNMTRLGISTDNTLPLSLNDAVKRALQNNNDIGVARDDVRFAETQLRALEGE